MSEEEEEGVKISATPLSEAHIKSETEGIYEEDNDEAKGEDGADQENDDAPPSLGLGDRIQIETKKYGRLIGRVYFLNETLLRVIPDGVSNRLYDFPITAEGIDPSIGVSDVLTEPTEISSFIEQNRLRVGARIDTFSKDGDETGSFEIVALNEDEDSIVIRDSNGHDEEIVFNFTGIPEDAPFDVIRVAPSVDPEVATNEEEAAPEEAAVEEDEGEIIGEIEIPRAAEVSEIPSAERIYPESVQKNDFLVDLLALLDTPSQKNMNIIKRLRAFVEVSNAMLRQTVIYAQDGSPIGGRASSIQQLLELLSTGKVPLSRPVLETIRTLYVDHSETHLARIAADLPSIEDEYKNDVYDVQYLVESIKKAEILASSTSSSQSDVGLPSFYNELNDVIQTLQRPWKNSGSGDPKYDTKVDTEFFRTAGPSEDPTIFGLNATMSDKIPVLGTPEYLNDKVRFSLLRTLAPTFRKSKTGKYVLALPSDKASLTSYLLFPVSLGNSLGSSRTCILSRDIGRSKMELKSMNDVVDEIGSATEIPSANTILNVGVHGNTLGNITISDYLEEVLKLINTPFTGLDDFRTMLIDLGLDAYELNLETMATLQNRILEDIARIRSFIATTRENITTEEGKVSVEPFLADDEATELKNRLMSEPILGEVIKEFAQKSPSFKDIDIAIISYLLKTKQDLTISALGNQEQLLQRERLRAQADTYLNTVHDALALRKRMEEAGVAPIPNKCGHVSALVSIRKIKDDSERITLLAKFMTRFQGTRDENFVECVVCDKHLLCIHEVLQIQIFYRPREQEALQKELLLKLSGGVFNGKYICRNCGQPISELQFDNHMEMNDIGRVISTNTIDDNSQEDNTVNPPEDSDIKFDNEAKTLCYSVAKEIYGRIGIQPDINDYRNLVENSFLKIQSFDSRQEYERKLKVAQSKGIKGAVDYDTYIKGSTVVSIAALILIDIQTHVPDYVVRYTLPGCDAGFNGYPLQSKENKTGIKYVSCAVGSIVRDDEPWNRTGFNKIRSDETRQKTIAQFMESILDKFLVSDSTIQQKIATKLEYLTETFGVEGIGHPKDKIPFGFLPKQDHIKAIDDETPTVVPEATDPRNSVGQRKLAAAWIREAHKHALRTAQLVRGNPFAETACCFGPISKPGAYWDEQKIQIPLSQRQAPVSPLFRNSLLFVNFTPKSIVEFPVEAPLNLAFRIFLKVCYKPPRMGYAHELGYNGVCDNCGIKLPNKYLYPDYTLQTKKKPSEPIINVQEIISDLQAQGLDVSAEFFQEVLDTSHINYIIPAIKVKDVTPANEILRRLGNLDPAPLPAWRETLTELITRLSSLTKNPDDAEIAIAYGPLSDTVGEAEEFIRRRLGASFASSILNEWISKDSFTLKQVIVSYLIIPLQRLLGNFDSSKLKVPSELYKIGYEHGLDLNAILAKHVETNSRFATSFNQLNAEGQKGIAFAKIEYFLQQIQGYLTFAVEMQPGRVPGGQIGVRYIKNALFLGPFAELLDFNRTPPGAGGEVAATSLVDRSGSNLVNFLTGIFNQYKMEAIAYSPEEIKLRIAKAKEKEKMNFIEDKDKMDDDAKLVDKVNQALGLGKWSIGGSKLIYAYDAGQYEREREERIRRGDTDIPLSEPFGANNIVYELGGIIPNGGYNGEDEQNNFYEQQGGFEVVQEDPDDF